MSSETQAMTCIEKQWVRYQYLRCGRPAKACIDGLHGMIPLCGIHANAKKRRGANVLPLPAPPTGESDEA